MLEASVSAMGWAVSNYLIGGVAPEPMGIKMPPPRPRDLRRRRRPINIAANRQEQFEKLCHAVGRPTC
jgi:crotonobetainyl-CoA:carnitine CoA-transferase CaiB-like acyl-CoA transferase